MLTGVKNSDDPSYSKLPAAGTVLFVPEVSVKGATVVVPAASVIVLLVMVLVVMVLLVNVSAPVSVAKVPVRGSVTVVVPLLVIVTGLEPENVTAPPVENAPLVVNAPVVDIAPPLRVIVKALLTPVPP